VVIDGHKSADHTDSPDGGTGKTYSSGGMHCPSVSLCYFIFILYFYQLTHFISFQRIVFLPPVL